mmetsp:Transcript_24029/g.66688  ORF Transcript_24029/g.66688 Transcript_24029/m.66688 type:complete len:84 (-) Transcript_24029:12-263(-)
MLTTRVDSSIVFDLDSMVLRDVVRLLMDGVSALLLLLWFSNMSIFSLQLVLPLVVVVGIAVIRKRGQVIVTTQIFGRRSVSSV